MMLNYFVGVDYFTWAIAGTVFVVGIGTIVALVQVARVDRHRTQIGNDLELLKKRHRDLDESTGELIEKLRQLEARLEVAANELFVARQDEVAAFEALRARVCDQGSTLESHLADTKISVTTTPSRRPKKAAAK